MRVPMAPSVAGVGRRDEFEVVCRTDFFRLCGVDGSRLGRFALDLALGGRVRAFAEALAAYDVDLAARGLAVASQALCARYGGSIVVSGTEHVSPSGPVLLVANHPGLMDTLAIYGTVPRPDIRALARPQPLLLLLSALAPNLLMLPDEGPGRSGGLRQVLHTLRDDGALLVFPAGHLEPEPLLFGEHGRAGAILPDLPTEPLGPWSNGVGTLVRLAARQGVPLQVVPTAISGVLSAETWHWFGPVARLRRTLRGREDLTAVLQVAFPRLGPTTVRVRYGPPLDAQALAEDGGSAETITARIRAAVLAELGPVEELAGPAGPASLDGLVRDPG